MIANLKAYPKMKDSGVPWLGEVPEHWKVARLKSCARNVVELQRDSGDSRCVTLEDVESWTGRIRIDGAADGQSLDSQVKRFTSTDVLFGKLRPYLAKVAQPEVDGCCVGEFLVLRSGPQMTPAYLATLLRSRPFIEAVASSTFGARMPRAEWSFIGALPIPVPSVEEQQAICRHLAFADRQIDRYITTKGKLIELLEEQKQAIIHQAVTRGMDPNVRLKSSGVGSMGEVPDGWQLSRVKNEFACLNSRRIPLSGPERGNMTVRRYDYYGASGVIDHVDDFLFDDELVLIAEDGANLVLRNLPLAFVARGKFWVNNHAHVLKPRRGNLEFLAGLMQSLDYRPWISGAAQPKLTQDRLMGIPIAVPPPQEQDHIVSIISQKTKLLDHCLEMTRLELGLWRELRGRLIADVVTGKITVRAERNALPREAENSGVLDKDPVE